MDIQLFTVKDYDKGLRPEQIRIGTRLTAFHYFPGAEFCFVGVDVLGVTHLWRASGRKNGKVNNMPTDLVKLVADPLSDVFFVARTAAGNYYAGNDLQKVKDGMTKAPEYEIYKFEVNFKKGNVIDLWFVEKVKQPKKF